MIARSDHHVVLKQSNDTPYSKVPDMDCITSSLNSAAITAQDCELLRYLAKLRDNYLM